MSHGQLFFVSSKMHHRGIRTTYNFLYITKLLTHYQSLYLRNDILRNDSATYSQQTAIIRSRVEVNSFRARARAHVIFFRVIHTRLCLYLTHMHSTLHDAYSLKLHRLVIKSQWRNVANGDESSQHT